MRGFKIRVVLSFSTMSGRPKKKKKKKKRKKQNRRNIESTDFYFKTFRC